MVAERSGPTLVRSADGASARTRWEYGIYVTTTGGAGTMPQEIRLQPCDSEGNTYDDEDPIECKQFVFGYEPEDADYGYVPYRIGTNDGIGADGPRLHKIEYDTDGNAWISHCQYKTGELRIRSDISYIYGGMGGFKSTTERILIRWSLYYPRSSEWGTTQSGAWTGDQIDVSTPTEPADDEIRFDRFWRADADIGSDYAIYFNTLDSRLYRLVHADGGRWFQTAITALGLTRWQMSAGWIDHPYLITDELDYTTLLEALELVRYVIDHTRYADPNDDYALYADADNASAFPLKRRDFWNDVFGSGSDFPNNSISEDEPGTEWAALINDLQTAIDMLYAPAAGVKSVSGGYYYSNNSDNASWATAKAGACSGYAANQTSTSALEVGWRCHGQDIGAQYRAISTFYAVSTLANENTDYSGFGVAWARVFYSAIFFKPFWTPQGLADDNYVDIDIDFNNATEAISVTLDYAGDDDVQQYETKSHSPVLATIDGGLTIRDVSSQQPTSVPSPWVAPNGGDTEYHRRIEIRDANLSGMTGTLRHIAHIQA